MKKTFIAAVMALMMVAPTMCSAQTIDDEINTVGVDRFAHAGMSYIINDQLHRNCHFNRFWAATTTIAIRTSAGATCEVMICDLISFHCLINAFSSILKSFVCRPIPNGLHQG